MGSVRIQSKLHTQSYDLSNSTHRIFFCPFYKKRKKEFLSSKNAKHVKVNFVDDVLAIDLKKIEGMIEENMTKMRPSSMKNHDVCM